MTVLPMMLNPPPIKAQKSGNLCCWSVAGPQSVNQRQMLNVLWLSVFQGKCTTTTIMMMMMMM